MKKLIAAAVVLVALIGAIPMTFLLMVSAPGGLLAQCAALAQATAAVPDVEFTPAQLTVAESIVEANPDGDVMLSSVAVAAAWNATQLQDYIGPLPIDPFTGDIRTSTTAETARALYGRLLAVEEWRTTTPQALTAWIAGTPTADLRVAWREGAVATSTVTGVDVQLLLNLEVVDPGCARTVSADWDGQYTVVNGWAFPAPVYDRLTSSYGYRRDPFTGQLRFHAGEDIAAQCGAPIIAARDGLITKWDEHAAGYGTVIEIYHDDGWRTRYAHMFPGTLNYYLGARVNQGDLIALVGSAGRSTGCHLHYEVINPSGHTVNPKPFLVG